MAFAGPDRRRDLSVREPYAWLAFSDSLRDRRDQSEAFTLDDCFTSNAVNSQ
jgi:hypothetical protein